ncbi:MAG TPA: tetratricopeptide repeat protein [Bacteroidia bacterium]|nr:tetratricopeptide repeat protein [Bacteroidia bacterium]
MIRIFILVILYLFFPVPAKSEFVFTPNCVQAYNEVILLNFSAAHQILAAERKSNPKNLIPEYIESYMDFLTAFISEEQKDFDHLKNKRYKRLEILDNDDKNSPYFLLTQAEINLQTAILKIKFQEYLTAAYEFRKGYKLLEENEKKFPGFIPNKKCLGLFHALIGSVPSNYKWLTEILGFRGTIPQGINELRDLLSFSEKNPSYNYMHDEAMILLMFFEFHLLKNGKSAMELAEKITGANADDGHQEPGPLKLFAVNSIYLYNGNNEKTISLLSNRDTVTRQFPLYYLDFMLGAAKLNNMDFTSENNFNFYLAKFKGRSFIKTAHLKLAWIHLLQGDTAGYFQKLKLVKTNGNEFTDEDKQALKQAESKEIPNIYLLRARLLFDGGYYDRAIAEIAGKNISYFPNYKDQLEVIYRLARIYDRQGKTEKAIDNYERTIKLGETKSFYFAANSALYLGLLYENVPDTVNAVKSYRKCLSLRNHEYQNSIDQKAEAGLNRLGVKE